MSIFNLLTAWKRPRTDAEFETWRMLELQMNAHLLGPGEGPLPHLFLTEKAAALFEEPDWRERAAAPNMFEAHNHKYLVAPFVAASMLVVLPLAGTVDAMYELFRLFASLAIKFRRPRYYNAEAKRRADRLAHQRSNAHRIRHRTSWLLPPSPCELLKAWENAHHRGAVKEKLRLGAMMSVIEAAIDNGVLRNLDGEIVGRKAGVKGWIMHNCSALAPHYSTLMRYKAAADKLAIASGLSDPCPEEILMDGNKENSDIAITVGTVGCPMLHKGAEQGNRVITITVGMKFPDGVARFQEGGDMGGTEKGAGVLTLTLTLRGVREGVTMEAVQRSMDYVLGCRRQALAIWREMGKGGHLRSFKTLDDFLYARIGLVREKRLHSPTRAPR